MPQQQQQRKRTIKVYNLAVFFLSYVSAVHQYCITLFSGSNTLPSKSKHSSGGGGTQSTTAATTIQKHWKGHVTRNKDEKVQDLKKEIRSLRTDEHIKHLTKELQSAKAALEQERKLRALQMDAIKVQHI